jgi:fibro-slime domain-containing protein
VGGLPVYTGICEAGGPNVNDAAKCPHGAQSTSQANFDMWYRESPDIYLAFPGVVPMTKVDGSDPVAYVFDGGTQFTPLTGIGWDAQGKEGLTENKNFGFTTELRYFFKYHGDEKLDFSGDDDVWVFINNKLAVDIGGLHPPQTKSVTLGAVVSNQLDLDPDVVYELVLFHAERRPNGSNFKLTLTGFLNETSVCTPK